MLGSQGYTEKQTPYEEAAGVPLIAYWKGHIYTGVSEELIGLVDLPVCLAGLAGLSFPGETDGKDLAAVFTDKEAKGRDCCYLYDLYPCHQAYKKGYSAWRAVRTHQYTYAVKPGNKDWLLFDNEADPYQMKNLAQNPAYGDVKADLWKLLSREIDAYDCLTDGETYVRMSGKLEEFNQSQIHFGFPFIGDEK